MQPAYERITPRAGESFRAFARRASSFTFSWHHHPEYELTLITSGSGTRFVGDAVTAYVAPDLVLLGPDLPHTWCAPVSDSQHEAVVIQFKPELMDCFALPECAGLQALLASAGGGLAWNDADRLAPAVRDIVERDGAERVAALLNALAQLAAAPCDVITAERTQARSPQVASRLDDACTYVIDHLADEDLSQPDVAAVAGMHPSAFARFFKQHTGRTLMTWIHELRVGAACERLRTTDASIASIAFDVGFGNLAQFNRVFRRRRDVTPREYRKRFRS